MKKKSYYEEMMERVNGPYIRSEDRVSRDPKTAQQIDNMVEQYGKNPKRDKQMDEITQQRYKEDAEDAKFKGE